MKKVLIFLSVLTLLVSCIAKPTEKDNLVQVLETLNDIKSATYYLTSVSSAPGDTTRFSEPWTRYFKMYVNPSDTLVGAKTARYDADDTTKMIEFYDGKVRGKVNWEEQYVKVDSFQNHPYPFRLVDYPMYPQVKEIIKYTLSTKDSIKTELHDFGDSLRFSLKIYNKHVYFHIKPIVIENEYIPEDEISQFDIWIRKSDNLPYRMRSKWHHVTYFQTLTNANINTTQQEDFIPTKFFPDVFEVVQYKRSERKPSKDWEGKPAPDWELKDLSNKVVSLKSLEGKVVMLKFTGVGCGPCHQSIPFLKELVKSYQKEDFELVSIETWSENIEGLKRYRDKNEMNFKFLNADDSIKKSYEVSLVPVFFILDEKRIIRKVIYGYSKETTDEQIVNVINELI
ncbi:peroxiredoxin family protein [Nafulsella turpanensis]|uniref:peroxiredoxin family protein n=1 Tax=Nafulsella turpanensis TaxID=1265690 RepID=UPI00034B9BEC|nr:TlpA disulfide reductase family protein [Nafulsella turpanensis]